MARMDVEGLRRAASKRSSAERQEVVSRHYQRLSPLSAKVFQYFENNYEKIVQNYGENEYLVEIKKKKMRKSDLEKIKVELLEMNLNQLIDSRGQPRSTSTHRQKWNEIKNRLTSENEFNDRPNSLLNKIELEKIINLGFLPRNSEKDDFELLDSENFEQPVFEY